MGIKYISMSAEISRTGTYRYSLCRGWDLAKPYCLFIGLNPSTADAENDDATIRRCAGFADSWGYGGIYMANLFAVRATNPKDMMTHPNPIGSLNNRWLEKLSNYSNLIIAAWGTKGSYLNRDRTAKALLKNMHCLGKTKDGHPKHPLYLPKNTELEVF